MDCPMKRQRRLVSKFLLTATSLILFAGCRDQASRHSSGEWDQVPLFSQEIKVVASDIAFVRPEGHEIVVCPSPLWAESNKETGSFIVDLANGRSTILPFYASNVEVRDAGRVFATSESLRFEVSASPAKIVPFAGGTSSGLMVCSNELAVAQPRWLMSNFSNEPFRPVTETPSEIPDKFCAAVQEASRVASDQGLEIRSLDVQGDEQPVVACGCISKTGRGVVTISRTTTGGDRHSQLISDDYSIAPVVRLTKDLQQLIVVSRIDNRITLFNVEDLKVLWERSLPGGERSNEFETYGWQTVAVSDDNTNCAVAHPSGCSVFRLSDGKSVLSGKNIGAAATFSGDSSMVAFATCRPNKLTIFEIHNFGE